ncbi:hypothetical protein WH47_10418, partial [Habropoda laboriosa]
ECRFTELHHPLYSSDLAPCDSSFGKNLKRICLDEYIASKSPSFYLITTGSVREKWREVVENNGEYFNDWLFVLFF